MSAISLFFFMPGISVAVSVRGLTIHEKEPFVSPLGSGGFSRPGTTCVHVHVHDHDHVEREATASPPRGIGMSACAGGGRWPILPPMSSPATEEASARKRKQLLLVAVVGAVILAAAGAFFMFGTMGRERDREEILGTGKPADGTILDIEDTGNRFNDQPEVILSLEVRPPDGPSYKAQARMILSPVHIPRFQPGAEVKLKVDPEDPSRVAVESVVTPAR
jgi:hypothetical protein